MYVMILFNNFNEAKSDYIRRGAKEIFADLLKRDACFDIITNINHNQMYQMKPDVFEYGMTLNKVDGNHIYYMEELKFMINLKRCYIEGIDLLNE